MSHSVSFAADSLLAEADELVGQPLTVDEEIDAMLAEITPSKEG